MRKEPRWISKSVALILHEILLVAHGGGAGLRDEGLLDSALANPQNLFAYEKPDIFQLASAYAHALTRDHPFNDGNKRVALTVAGVFLELNGFQLEASEVDAVRAMLALSTCDLDEAGFADWLRTSFRRIRGTSARPSRGKKPRSSR